MEHDVGKKRNFEELEPFIDSLPAKFNLHRGRRSSWPQYIYHSTEVNDAVSILDCGYVYSRNKAKELGLLQYDIASESVLASTRNKIKEYARFYLRPGTPTQYNNEGIRPEGLVKLDSHCPIPIYLLFDSVGVLSMKSTRFSGGNLGRLFAELHSSVEEFKKLPFQAIYHVGPLPSALIEKDKIINCRNAEVVVPEQLSIDYLKLIYCRSDAEKDTLLSLLSADAYNIWNDHIIVDRLGQLFHKKWTFVDKVRSVESKITLSFSPDSITPGPFKPSIEIYDLERNLLDSHDYNRILCNKVYNFPFKRSHGEYMIKVFLDDNLCYQGYHLDYDLPF